MLKRIGGIVITAREMSNNLAKRAAQQPKWYKPERPKGEGPALRIYNSLTRNKDEFIPVRNNSITWYSCGPTVYDHSHMGHARNYVSTDICRRILQDYFGYNVKFIQNVTDIDDKIIIAARQEHLFEQELLSKYNEVTPELIELSKEFLERYIRKNIPQFGDGDVAKGFVQWSKSINRENISASIPKFPMFLNAALRAHGVIYSAPGEDYNIDNFFASIKEVAIPDLDQQYGRHVNDPFIFKKMPSYWERKYYEDMGKLKVLSPTITTRVSEYIPEIIDYVEKIINNGFAYPTSDGSVYFDTVKFENDPKHDYAKLQPWNKGDLEMINDGEGSLSLNQHGKKNAADFALWKASKPGEPSWPSKWGEGRPGWHIECSVMASYVGGDVLDIHSGGIDLCFPHHDNELAQSEAYFNNRQWINYFMHNGHLHIEGQKMSKSLKNFITIQEALRMYSSRQLRLVFALNPWEKPLDFKESLIKEVKSIESTYTKFFTTVRALYNDYNISILNGIQIPKKHGKEEEALLDALNAAQAQTHAAFCDNLSSGQVLKIMIDLVSKSNNYIQMCAGDVIALRVEVLLDVTFWIVKILNILGFETRPDNLGWMENKDSQNKGSTEEALIPYVKTLSNFRDDVRNSAINKKPYADFLNASDSVRSELFDLGVSLDDRPNGAALVKFLDLKEKEELLKQKEAKVHASLEKEARKKQQQLANVKKEEERLAKLRVKPSDLFKDTSLYSEWDEQGIPTKSISGEEITKSMRKKLVKQQQQQEKLYQEYLSNNQK